jgi:hypothetical protein
VEAFDASHSGPPFRLSSLISFFKRAVTSSPSVRPLLLFTASAFFQPARFNN